MLQGTVLWLTLAPFVSSGAALAVALRKLARRRVTVRLESPRGSRRLSRTD
jgi:hypothetical protein